MKMYCNTTLDLICKLQDLSHTREEEALANSFNFWFNGVFGGLIAIAGLITNSITVFILCSMKERNARMNFLLCFLLVTNNFFLATQLVNILYWDFAFDDFIVIMPKFIYPLQKTTLTMAVFCTISLAYEACLIIWDQDNYGKEPSTDDLFWRKGVHTHFELF